jgi:hypothetical protein
MISLGHRVSRAINSCWKSAIAAVIGGWVCRPFMMPTPLLRVCKQGPFRSDASVRREGTVSASRSTVRKSRFKLSNKQRVSSPFPARFS